MTREEAIMWLNQIKDRYIRGGDDSFDASRKQALDMAIEALQGGDADMTGTSPYMQPSPDSGVDLIGRADAIKAVAEHFSFDDGCSNIYKDIDYYKGIAEHILKNVPSALPSAEAKWIPCSERLPENIGRYIVTLKDIWATTVKVAVYGVMPQDTHNKKVFWLYDSCYDDLDITEDVTAWMPLPEPCREGDEV